MLVFGTNCMEQLMDFQRRRSVLENEKPTALVVTQMVELQPKIHVVRSNSDELIPLYPLRTKLHTSMDLVQKTVVDKCSENDYSDDSVLMGLRS